MSIQLVPPLIDAPSVGGRIRQARRLREMTQQHLADAIGSSRESIGAWERGKTSVPFDDLVDIARAVRLPIGLLVDGLDGQPPIGPGGGGGRWAPWDSNPQPAETRSERHLTAVAELADAA
jgi:transcriptional regulator with XRE-family HTH domain